MSTRRLFVCAFITAAVAVLLHVLALSQFTVSNEHRALAVSLADPERTAANARAQMHSAWGHAAMYTGLALAAGSIVLVCTSARRREPARRIIVVGVLLCYGLLLLVLV